MQSAPILPSPRNLLTALLNDIQEYGVVEKMIRELRQQGALEEIQIEVMQHLECIKNKWGGLTPRVWLEDARAEIASLGTTQSAEDE